MFKIIWQFEVNPNFLDAFVSAYKSDGDWDVLFRKSEYFLGTELLVDNENPYKFITIDKWTDCEAFDAFKKEFKTEYLALDKNFEAYTITELHIGDFIIK